MRNQQECPDSSASDLACQLGERRDVDGDRFDEKKAFELTQTRERVLARVRVLMIVQLAVDAASSLPYAFLMHGT